MVSFGTSSDRIFTPPGYRAWFVTFAKTVPGTKIAPYAGLSYSEFEKKILFPAGVNWQIDDTWSVMPMFDGRNGHLLFTWSDGQVSATAMLVKGRNFGLSLSYGF